MISFFISYSSKSFVFDTVRPDPRPLIYVCDLHDFVEELWQIVRIGSDTRLSIQGYQESSACCQYHLVLQV